VLDLGQLGHATLLPRRAFEQRAAELPVELVEFEAFGEPLHARLRALAAAAAPPEGGPDRRAATPCPGTSGKCDTSVTSVGVGIW
jgi:hypothetical protein